MAVLHFMYPRGLVQPSQPEGCVFSHTSTCLPVSGAGGGTFDVPENMPKATGTFGFSYSCHPLSRLIVRGFPLWLTSLDLDCSHHLHCYVRVSVEYVMALHQ